MGNFNGINVASAFHYLKNKLCDSPLVSHPRRGFTFHLATDACAGDDDHKGGFDAVLSQIWEDGAEHVIAYASRPLKPNKENYSAYLLELAAASWASDHFLVYLCGKHFELFTDHKPLEALSKVNKKTLNRLEQQLLEYDFKIIRKPIPSPLNPLFGPLKVRSANGKKYIMFMTDAFSKYTELAAICDKKADTVAKVFFEHWICRHGVPAVIVSDRGKEFLNDTMKK